MKGHFIAMWHISIPAILIAEDDERHAPGQLLGRRAAGLERGGQAFPDPPRHLLEVRQDELVELVARELLRADRLDELVTELGEDVKHAVVIFGFGSVDVEWNLSYKRSVLISYLDDEMRVSRTDDGCYFVFVRVRDEGGALEAADGTLLL